MRKFERSFLLSSIAVILFSAGIQAQQPAQPTAAEILKKVAEVYATCRSYADEGEVNIQFSGNQRSQRFRTAFVRSTANFRFDIRINNVSRDSAYIACQEGQIAKLWSPFGVGEREAPLDLTLIFLAPLSYGVSLTIPQLLQPDLFRVESLFESFEEVELSGEDKIDGRQSFRITAKVRGQTAKLWIDKTDFLILKTYRKVLFGGSEQESTAQYKPRINVDVPHESLDFRPRAAKSNTMPTITAAPKPALIQSGLEPRLRNFGSSLISGSERKASYLHATDEDTVRVDTNLVVCDVMVLDNQGKIIRNLRQEDFVVKEDNTPQEIGIFSQGDNRSIPRSIVLILDYSGSQLPYIKTSVEAAKMLVDKLNPRDRMALVTDDVVMLVDFTSDKELLKEGLDSLKASAIGGKLGRSDQYDALMATLQELFDEEDIRPIIIFQTDGDQLDALKGGSSSVPYTPPRKYSFADILAATDKGHVTVYPVIPGVQFFGAPQAELVARARQDWENRKSAGMGRPISKTDPLMLRNAEQWSRRQMALAVLGKYTGVFPEFLERPEQADEIYTRVLTDINRRYIIGYYPTNRTHDGKRRKVGIEVRNHPEYIVWGRKTYLAPGPER